MPRGVWFGAALVLFVAATVVAFLQPARLDPYAPPEFPSLDWWRSPREVAAHRRLPFVTNDLYGVFALPGTHKVWAVGEAGLILRSDDEGRTWQGQLVPMAPTASPPNELNASPVQQQGPTGSRNALPNQSSPPAQSDPKEAAQFRLDPGRRGWESGPAAALRNAALLPGRRALDDTPQGAVPESSRDAALDAPLDSRINATTNARLEKRAGAGAWVFAAEPPKSVDPKKPSAELLKMNDSARNKERRPADSAGGSTSPDQVYQQGDAGSPGGPAAPPSGGEGAVPSGPPGLRAVFFTDAGHGWAVGTAGTIVSTTDGGNTWRLEESSVTVDLLAVRFADAQSGWAVGEGGVVLKYANGAWSRDAEGSSA
ncbi:MAG TPA: YCF48-related protein, partial [Candidatus Saccharimonadales bacterium]|nr:YCF48-related protein [Candidatus Saccharimonadales bacterium]